MIVTETNFLDHCIKYECGQSSEYETLCYFHYLYVNELHKRQRFYYSGVINDLINYGVLTKDKINFGILSAYHDHKRKQFEQKSGVKFNDLHLRN